MRAYAVWTFWNEEVGEAIARRAQPAEVRNGVLFVTVATHSWIQELRFMKEQIRERLNARLGAPLVRDICFESGSIAASPPPRSVTPDPAAVRAEIGRIALPPIADAQLADAFTRLVEAHAKRAPARRERTRARRRRR